MDLKIGPRLALCVGLIAPIGAVAQQTLNTSATIVYYDSSGNATLDPAEPQNASS